jgi:VanZ family protein
VNRHKLSRILVVEYWFPLLLWLGLQYWFSTDNFSAGETAGFIIPILRFLLPGFSPSQLEFLHFAVRKMAHISEYTVLGVLAYRAVKYDDPDFVRVKVLSFAFVVLAAMTDEFHQSFTLWRGASIVDVGYDSFGGLLAIWGSSLLGR